MKRINVLFAIVPVLLCFAFAGCKQNADEQESSSVVPDTWVKVTNSPFIENITVKRIIYGGGKYVATASTAQTDDGSNMMAFSSDGMNWDTVKNDPFNGTRVDGLAYGNGRFVAATYNPTKIAYSTDGETWTLSTDNTFSASSGLVFGSGNFVLSSNSKIGYSDNGESWASVQSPLTNNMWIFYCGGRFFLSGFMNKLAYSLDGVNWTDITDKLAASAGEITFDDMAYGNDVYVASGAFLASGTQPLDKSAYSTDGINWIENTEFIGLSVAYGGGFFVGGGTTGEVAYSKNGVNWTSVPTENTEGIYAITYGKNRFVYGHKNDLFYSNKLE